MPAMNKAYLLIGGNMGDRENYLSSARKEIQRICGPIVQQSSLYETVAWGLEAQNAFLNQAIIVDTELEPTSLLTELLRIETSLGRKREVRYGPRTIDIDILFFNDAVIHTQDLIVPHPQVQNRRFALTPTAQIAPDLIHPLLQKSIAQLLAECPDSLPVHKIS